MTYRPLTEQEISQLERHGCGVEGGDWGRVKVAAGFDATRVRHATFGGEVRIGSHAPHDAGPGPGPEQGGPAGVFHARLVNCTLGDNVRIANVGVHLANYNIGDGACIENVGLMETSPGARFGNGVEINLLNEAGGREVILHNDLSSQFAHLMCLHRHRPKLVESLAAMSKQAAAALRADRGQVARGVLIRSVPEILNVNFGEQAKVVGASRLVDGSVLSSAEAPSAIGAGVLSDEFIIAEGSEVTGGAILSKTYVGQGCRVGRQFSAESCALFANCEAFHGEACSVLAGPYTVTHHKSTLLIAAMFSFYNAGSGTNSSNHMYKLGPVHEGKLERGCKTGSFSYLMWPCRVGPFSVVLGKHSGAFDTADLPFSTIEASADGHAALVPGLNLATVGTVRDAAKWPARDRRRGSVRRDRITFDVWSPLIAERMMRGLAILKDLQEKTDKSVVNVAYQGVEIKRVFLRLGQKYYRRAISMYLADQVVSRLESAWTRGVRRLPDALAVADSALAGDRWLDIGGQLMTSRRLEDLCSAVESGRIASVAGVEAALDGIQQAYGEDQWLWVRQACRQVLDVDLATVDAAGLCEIAELLRRSQRELLELILVDATKEFDAQSRTGFGLDGDIATNEADFLGVRGRYDDHTFVRSIRQQIERLDRRIDHFRERVAAAA